MHELILAKGVAAKTFVDSVDACACDSRDEYEVLRGQPPPIPQM